MSSNLEAIRAEENFVADAQLLLHEIMLDKDITRAQLAEMLGVSRPRISQIFSSDCRNFTVRLLARALHALGEKAVLSCEWEQRRQRRMQLDNVRFAARQPFSYVDSIWAEEGDTATLNDTCGEARPDSRVRELFKSRLMTAANDVYFQVA